MNIKIIIPQCITMSNFPCDAKSFDSGNKPTIARGQAVFIERLMQRMGANEDTGFEDRFQGQMKADGIPPFHRTDELFLSLK